MKLTVSYNGQAVAIITIERNAAPAVQVIDPTFQSSAERLSAGRVSVMQDHFTKATNTIYLTSADQSDEHYPLAIKQFLERNGFEVDLDTPELDQVLVTAIQSLPDDLKAEAQKDIPHLTTLEKSILVEKLTPAPPSAPVTV